jgi:hypothetical protein
VNTIFAAPRTAPQPTASQASGLAQIETLSVLERLTGVPAVEWLECPAETTEQRAARLERIADVMLELPADTARTVAALHREILAEPAYVEIERVDRVFGPVVTRVPVEEPASYAGQTRCPATAATGTAAATALAGVRAA